MLLERTLEGEESSGKAPAHVVAEARLALAMFIASDEDAEPEQMKLLPNLCDGVIAFTHEAEAADGNVCYR